jgi:integrase/recombinase XerC
VIDGDEFVELMLAEGYSTKTTVLYRTAALHAEAWLEERGEDLDTVGPTMVRELAESQPRGRSSRSLLRSALTAYWRLSGRTDGPTAAIRVPRRRRMKCRALDAAAAELLAIEAARRRDRKGLAVLLGLYAGLRRNEIATLRWADIAGGWVTVVGKGDRERDIPLHPTILEALAGTSSVGDAHNRQRLEFLFPGRFGGHQNPTTIWTWTREVGVAAGVGPVAPHVLRHTALSAALDATGDLRSVQELAGHASPETTAGYTRVGRDRLVEAVTAICYTEGAA